MLNELVKEYVLSLTEIILIIRKYTSLKLKSFYLEYSLTSV